MLKFVTLFILLLTQLDALDFAALKERIIAYVDSLDHPNRDQKNKFAKNLAIAKEAVDTHMMIYSSGLAMVREEKNVTIAYPGDVKIMYENVPSKVDLSSVSMVFDHNVTLYSQRYAYDVVNFHSLLRRYQGKYILYINDKTDKKEKKAVLLATDPVIVKDLKSGTIFTPYKVFFEDIPEDMAVTPTLFWDVHTGARDLHINLEYLTDGIAWSCDYNLYMKGDGRFDLSSWISIVNESGASYKDTNITIVTGKIKQVEPQEQNGTKPVSEEPAAQTEQGATAKGIRYALYQIEHREDLPNKTKKQVLFFQKKGIRYSEYLMNEKRYDFSDGNQSALHFSKILAFENRETNHLGMPLPQGIVRVYAYDSLSSKRFVGSARIPNIKKGERVELTMNGSPEIVGEEKRVSFEKTELEEHISYSVKLKNTSDRTIEAKLKRSIPEKVGEIRMQDNCRRQCSKEQLSPLSTLYRIRMEPDQLYELKIEYDINSKTDTKKEAP